MNRLTLCFLAVITVTATACDEEVINDQDVSGADVLCPDAASDSETGDDTVGAGDCQIADTWGDPCHAGAACQTDGQHCFAPGDLNCGNCMEIENPCEGDQNCLTEPYTICDYPVTAGCYCNWGKTCLQPCGVEGGTICSEPDRPECVEGRCVATPCTDDSGCPAMFTCLEDDTGKHCERRTCTENDECGECAWCVNGACHTTPGTCSFMAP